VVTKPSPAAPAEADTPPPPAPDLRGAHVYAREKGPLRPFYAFVRALLTPFLLVWFRVRVSGAENIPANGAAIIAPNHKSFIDAFIVGLATRRHVRFMAKVELFSGPLTWFFLRLGAFPVRRGEADEDAVETARAILRDGGLLVLFPEGTRVDEPDALGAPHHGAGRLARETGAPIVPAAIYGTSHLWLGPILRPRRVRLAFAPPIHVPELPPTELIDREVWPVVQREYGRLRGTPGLIVSVLAAIGVGGGLLARRRAKGTRPRVLGVVEPRKLRRRRRGRFARGRDTLRRGVPGR
jgi:1-acyl-sn-glycerol-3-phosphate acyltransferase